MFTMLKEQRLNRGGLPSWEIYWPLLGDAYLSCPGVDPYSTRS